MNIAIHSLLPDAHSHLLTAARTDLGPDGGYLVDRKTICYLGKTLKTSKVLLGN